MNKYSIRIRKVIKMHKGRVEKKTVKVWTNVQSGPTLPTYPPSYGQNLVWA